MGSSNKTVQKRWIDLKNQSAAASTLLKEFSENSTFHGVKYLGERRRHWIERAFWIIAFSVSVLGCSMMIGRIYVKWQHSPVIVSFAEKPTPMWKIPFPAVTICPETKVLSKFLNLTKAYHQTMSPELFNSTPTDGELKILEALTQVCDARLFEVKAVKSSLHESELVSILKKVAPKLYETIPNVWWRNNLVTEVFTGFNFLIQF